MEKQAKKALRKLEAEVTSLPITPSGFTFLDLLHVTQQLFFQKEYRLVIDICESTSKRLYDIRMDRLAEATGTFDDALYDESLRT